eukprot:gene12678-biopygen14039
MPGLRRPAGRRRCEYTSSTPPHQQHAATSAARRHIRAGFSARSPLFDVAPHFARVGTFQRPVGGCTFSAALRPVRSSRCLSAIGHLPLQRAHGAAAIDGAPGCPPSILRAAAFADRARGSEPKPCSGFGRSRCPAADWTVRGEALSPLPPPLRRRHGRHQRRCAAAVPAAGGARGREMSVEKWDERITGLFALSGAGRRSRVPRY